MLFVCKLVLGSTFQFAIWLLTLTMVGGGWGGYPLAFGLQF